MNRIRTSKDEYDSESPGRQGRQEKRIPEITIPGVPGVLAVDFILK